MKVYDSRIDAIHVPVIPKKASLIFLEWYIVAVVLDPTDALSAWLQRRMVELLRCEVQLYANKHQLKDKNQHIPGMEQLVK